MISTNKLKSKPGRRIRKIWKDEWSDKYQDKISEKEYITRQSTCWIAAQQKVLNLEQIGLQLHNTAWFLQENFPSLENLPE